VNQRPEDDITNGWGLGLTRREVAESLPPALLLAVVLCALFYVFMSQ
jgi:hypothetical protein